MVAQAYNPNYMGARNWEKHSSRIAQVKCGETPSQLIWIWQYISTIPATQEAHLGDLWA
jgi:hypothetical protein